MSFESIIGITSGIIGIGSFVYLLYQKLKSLPATELFNKLADKSLSQKEHQNALRKLDNYLLAKVHKGLKSEYITNFANNNRGKEAIFADICEQNDIEPTKVLCDALCGYDMKAVRDKYYEKRSKASTNESTILSSQSVSQPAEIVYVSELLKTKFPDCFNRLTAVLDKHNVKYSLLKGTKDIWCRDYMPVQLESGKLIQFKYDPSYLKGKKEWEDSRSDVKEVCKLNNLDVTFSGINIDGGNVLLCDGRAILSDRIFSENPDWDKESLVAELSKLLESEIIIIPAQKGDFTGHADGMVRFVNKHTILGNALASEYKYWQEGMKKVIEKYNLKYIDVPFFTDPKHSGSAVGIYVNYLELNDLIVMPLYNRPEDTQVYNILKESFPNKTIEGVDYSDVALEGGILNCSTWVRKLSTSN